MKSPREIINILHSIQNVRLNEGQVEADFIDLLSPNRWESNEQFVFNTFTYRLLLLIEAELKGELS